MVHHLNKSWYLLTCCTVVPPKNVAKWSSKTGKSPWCLNWCCNLKTHRKNTFYSVQIYVLTQELSINKPSTVIVLKLSHDFSRGCYSWDRSRQGANRPRALPPTPSGSPSPSVEPRARLGPGPCRKTKGRPQLWRFIMVHHGSSWFIMVHDMVHHGSSWYPC